MSTAENITKDLSSMTILVVGASRGLGRGIANTLADAGSPVIAVSRTPHAPAHPGIRTEVADATDAAAAGRLLDRHDPDAVVLVAGASPVMRPLQDHTWDTFSANWHADVQIAFHWLREALRRPLRPGGRVIVFSSGAAVAGSPLSGGYAGAKATQRLMTTYARDEAERAGLDITLTAVLPRITPATDLGRLSLQAYAARAGQDEEEYIRQQGEPLTPEVAGAAVADLLRAEAGTVAPAYLLTAAGLGQLP